MRKIRFIYKYFVVVVETVTEYCEDFNFFPIDLIMYTADEMTMNKQTTDLNSERTVTLPESNLVV